MFHQSSVPNYPMRFRAKAPPPQTRDPQPREVCLGLTHHLLPGGVVQSRARAPLNRFHGPAGDGDFTGLPGVYHRVVHAVGAHVPMVVMSAKKIGRKMSQDAKWEEAVSTHARLYWGIRCKEAHIKTWNTQLSSLEAHDFPRGMKVRPAFCHILLKSDLKCTRINYGGGSGRKSCRFCQMPMRPSIGFPTAPGFTRAFGKGEVAQVVVLQLLDAAQCLLIGTTAMVHSQEGYSRWPASE